MAKWKRSHKAKPAGQKTGGSLREVLSLYTQLANLKKEMAKSAELGEREDDRLTDLEVHVNLLARLLTTLCIEKMGIGVGALKRLVRRVEKEALRDSQIMELESLYNLAHGHPKKSSSTPAKAKDDPWDQIS